MLKGIYFKGCHGIELENEFIRIIVLPAIGGKIASFYHKEKEFEVLFQNNKNIYRKPKIYADFAEFDASGFDDCFPSINRSIVNYGDEEIIYPDHGEIWSAAFNYTIKGEEIELYFPAGTSEVENILESKYLGKIGTVHPFPVTSDKKGQEFRLDRVLPVDSNNFEKYYIHGEVERGECGVYYPKEKVSFRIFYDSNLLPYLGFWVTEGGFRGDYNCAFEPANGYYDSIEKAEANNKVFELLPGCHLEFSLKLILE